MVTETRDIVLHVPKQRTTKALICAFVVRIWHKTHFLMAWFIYIASVTVRTIINQNIVCNIVDFRPESEKMTICFVFWFCQDYSTHFEPIQSLGGEKMGPPSPPPMPTRKNT